MSYYYPSKEEALFSPCQVQEMHYELFDAAGFRRDVVKSASTPGCGSAFRVSLFVRGEVNGDGSVDISDALTILTSLFLGFPRLVCEDAADTNDDGSLAISDAIYLLGYLFLGTERPPEPAPGQSPLRCGTDPTADALVRCDTGGVGCGIGPPE